jgi:murein endopeptidase
MRRCGTTLLSLALGASLFAPSAHAGEHGPCEDCGTLAEHGHAEPPDEAAELEAFLARLKADAAGHHDHRHENPEPPAIDPREPAREVKIDIDDRELRRRVQSDLRSLGPISVGEPQHGVLVNAVKFPDGPHWELVSPYNAYATQETIDFLIAAIQRVEAEAPGGHKLYIGDISAQRGGHLGGHVSHQSGRDVDTSYYFRVDEGKRGWYRRATADNLDLPRTWAFVRGLVTESDVMFIFINTSIQKLLKEHALASGEDPKWLDRVFEYQSKEPWPIVRHSPGHDTHIHVRFYNPQAQELGRRAHGLLVDRGIIKPRVYYSSYTAKKGDMLGRIAKQFDTTVEELQKANGLRDTTIHAGRTYRIPRKGNVTPIGKVVIPPRRLPPESGSGSSRTVAGPGN